MNIRLNSMLLAALVAVVMSSLAQAQLNVPEKLEPAAEHLLRKALDKVEEKVEQKKSTRFGSGTITPTGGLPDLAITLIKKQGTSRVHVTVVNVGDLMSYPSQVMLKVIRLSDRQELARRTMNLRELHKRQATTLSFSGLPLNDVRVLAIADPQGKMREKDERNNSRTRVLDSRRPSTVDLVVDRITRTGNGLLVEVANRGNSNAAPTELLVAVRRKSDRKIIFRKTVWVAGIGGGGQAKVQISGLELSNLSHTDVFATCDHTRKMRETNENNNTRHVSFGL